MKRPILGAMIAVLMMACGGSPAGTPASGLPASPTSPGSSSAASAPAADATVVEARAPGVTIKEGDSGAVDLQGGHYRIAWYAPGCTMLGLQVAAKTGETTSIDVRLPSGESELDLPAGVFAINRVGDCDYTVRFEEAS